MISESIALKRIFEEDTLKKALEEFFQTQAAAESAKSAECMSLDNPAPEMARKYACFAKAYEEAMNRLRDYAHKV